MISLCRKNEDKLNIYESSWKQLVIGIESTISDAISILDKTALKIVIVTDDQGYLLGTVTDGDIRRGLLQGMALTDAVDRIVYRQTITVTPDVKQKKVLQLMVDNKIQQIPIVNNENRVLGIHVQDNINSVAVRSNLMVIMAGGMGTRLRPATENLPKPMLQVAGRPILEHIIEKAKADGFTNFVISIFYLGNIIENHFKDGKNFGVNIEYLKDKGQ